MNETDGIDGNSVPSEYPEWSANDEERASQLRRRINQRRNNSADNKSHSSRMSSVCEVQTKSQDGANSRVFTDFDVLAEIASFKDGLLKSVQKSLSTRGCDFATLGYIKSVIRNKPDLVIEALCSSTSVVLDRSSPGSPRTTFDEPENKNLYTDKSAVVMRTSSGSECEADDQSFVSSLSGNDSASPMAAAMKETRMEDNEDLSACSSSSYGQTVNTVAGARDVVRTQIVLGLDTEDFKDASYMRPATSYFQLSFPVGDKIPVNVVEFNGPDDIVVQRQDLNHNCEKIGISLAAWLKKNPVLGDHFQCQRKCIPGTPVMFNPDGGWKRAVVTSHVVKETKCCNIRLIDLGTVHLNVPVDGLLRLSCAHGALAPLISKVSLGISTSTEKSDLVSMKRICLQGWKEAIYECSGENNSRNYSVGDLITKDTGLSLKKELAGYVSGNLATSTNTRVLVGSFTMPRVKKSTMLTQRNEGMGFPILRKVISNEITGPDILNTTSPEAVDGAKHDLQPRPSPILRSTGFPKLAKKM